MKRVKFLILAMIFAFLGGVFVLTTTSCGWFEEEEEEEEEVEDGEIPEVVVGALNNLTGDCLENDQNPAFSPDGFSLIFSSGRSGVFDIWSMKINGSEVTQVTSDPEADDVNMPGASWCAGNDRIVFSSDRVDNDEIWTMRPEGADLQRVTNDEGADWEPTWSPDCEWIVFQSDRDGNWELYKIRPDGSGLTRLSDDPAQDWEPNWSPQGDKILFQSDRSGKWDIWTINIDGSSPINLTDNPAEDTDPSWSPDGKWIVYSSNYGGLEEPDIFILKLEGDATPVRLTEDPAYDGAPSWSPEGTKIAFESDRSGNLDIWIKLLVDSFAYQLQNTGALSELGSSAFDLVVMDYSSDGCASGQYTQEQISALKDSPGGRKTVLSYLSIGEAEDYRYYWQEGWESNPPSWLGPENPEWEGNYKVRYWEKGWQDIIFGTPDSYLDKIIAAGFDGVYLDIIDAYEFWGPEGNNQWPEAEQDMVDFVKAIAQYARLTKPAFMIIPQNGSDLVNHPDYLEVISGQGAEDTWYSDNDLQDTTHTLQVVPNLDKVVAAGKLVLAIDYVTEGSLIDDFYSRASERGYIPYASTRDLDQLTINPGHEP